MADESAPDTSSKPKQERSPSFPFISLKKAVERAETLYANHKREAARLVTVAITWGYGAKSSGLLQTVAALKQFGLVEDLGSGEDRKIQITDLARRILADSRPGARENAIKEAAVSPKVIAEYLPKWVPERPSDAHCISELHLDRGFTADSARAFLRIFDETVAYANLDDDAGSRDERKEDQSEPAIPLSKVPSVGDAVTDLFLKAGPKPLSERLEVTMNGRSLAGTFTLLSSEEVDTVIKILEANRGVLKALEDIAKAAAP